jgi:xanthine dehydrogenase small subunit
MQDAKKILEPNNAFAIFTAFLIQSPLVCFILNDITIRSDLSPGITLLDFIRYHRNLTGTKIGCREGDCGACTVLLGEWKEDQLAYRPVTSCLMPLGNASGKHVVTVEGINGRDLTPVQQAMLDEGATQCGFCTPGFVMSLTGFCLQEKSASARESFDGNICRCTGYKSIERAAGLIENTMKGRMEKDGIDFSVEQKIVPAYFREIRNRLAALASEVKEVNDRDAPAGPIVVGGGTDLYVQKHEAMTEAVASYLADAPALKGIRQEGERCVIGSATTVTELKESKLIRNIFPHFNEYVRLISSTPIRNMATLGGNFVNASPIGDFTIFFLALDATITLKGYSGSREIFLKDFYLGYKKLDQRAGEIIDTVSFVIPGDHTYFNFEKVSKRTNLDIASVNSALKITVRDNVITEATLSAGGVGPVPMILKKTSAFLTGKILNENHIVQACGISGQDISPISDARGSESYKRYLLQQLIKAHFITLFHTISPQKLETAYEEY